MALFTEQTISLLKNNFTGVGLDGQLVKEICSIMKPEGYLHGQVGSSETHRCTCASG